MKDEPRPPLHRRPSFYYDARKLRGESERISDSIWRRRRRRSLSEGKQKQHLALMQLQTEGAAAASRFDISELNLFISFY
jgi:hypothetical protein